MDQNELIDKITREVLAKLQRGSEFRSKPAGTNNGVGGQKITLNSPADAASIIDHTLLKPEATQDQFDKLCAEAIQYRFWSVCVNTNWTAYWQKLRGTGVKVCSVVGFPLAPWRPGRWPSRPAGPSRMARVRSTWF